MDENRILNPSGIVLLNAFFKSFPAKLKNIPIGKVKDLVRRKPRYGEKFAFRLHKNLIESDLWVAKDLDILSSKIYNLPQLVTKSSPAQRVFRNWRAAINIKGPLGLDKSLLRYRRVLSPLLNNPKISPDEKKIVEAALIWSSKGIEGIAKQLRQDYLVDDVWRLPSGKRMRFFSEFQVNGYEDEQVGEETPFEPRIADPAPYNPEEIAMRGEYNRFNLESEINKNLALTRLERQILLLKCKGDISFEEIANELSHPIESIPRIFLSARKKMNSWLEMIGIKEVIQSNEGRTDHFYHWLFHPPFRIHDLPDLDNYEHWSKHPDPIMEWLSDNHDQEFLKALIPSLREKI